MKDKYSIRDLKKDFPTDEACLKFLFESQHNYKCSCGGLYSPMNTRKQYQCSKCRYQISPTANTIFHKSKTPLTLWFHAIFIFSNAKSGISAKEMERQLGVTYKCAWRMLNQIRKTLKQSDDKLHGDVETDTAYFGGRKKAGKDNENLSAVMKTKNVVMGAVERKGRMKAIKTPNAQAKTIGKFLEENVDKDNTRLLTDNALTYRKVAVGFDRHFIDHSKEEYVKGDIHINTMETFWSHTKRSIKGTYKVISKQHFQSYLDGFVFHYNNRYNDRKRFSVLIETLLSFSRG